MMHIEPWERIDDLQWKGLRIIQDTRAFCFGVDAVLLANFASVHKGERVLDFCSGTGIIPILIAGKTQASEIYGMEIQEGMAKMAERSIALNQLNDRVKMLHADLMNAREHFAAASAEVITCNPPYMPKGSGLVNPSDTKAIARHELSCTLADIIGVSAKILTTGGKLAMVHRPERLVDIVWYMRQHDIEPKRLQFIHPSSKKAANLILVEGVRKGKAGLKLLEPIYVYDEQGQYSAQINRIYGL